MSCEGCNNSARGQAYAREAVTAEAAKYAQKNNTTVVIWKEGLEYFYAAIGSAAAAGKPVIQHISQYNGIAAV